MATVYHESFKAEKFRGFRGFLYVCETLLYENLSSNIDLRESMWDLVKVFSRRSACKTFHKTFLPRNFHGSYTVYSYIHS